MTVLSVFGMNTMYMQNAELGNAPRVGIIGGGAAGLLAAGTALSFGASVTVFEHGKRLGCKLLITGKGRCNVTNDSSSQDIIRNITRNAPFLYSALSAFSPSDVMALFEELGVPLKTERGQRVFPASDKSADIVAALLKYTKDCRIVREHVRSIELNDGRAVGIVADKPYAFDAVILATGGVSYPRTGSDGSGHAIAASLGHTVTPLLPSLVPLTSPSRLCREMQGLSLRNVALTVRDKGRTVYTDFGEMLFTHFGMSGPMILSASAHLRDTDFSDTAAEIDLKPALDEKMLDARLLSDFGKTPNKDFGNALAALLPSKMILPFLTYVGMDAHRKVHTITREERMRIRSALKSFSLPISGFRPIEEAIVTSGGVDVREVTPKTMMSKLVQNLFFAGEILDVDAYTGGFNLQIAFSTGYLAGRSAATLI